MGRDLTVDQKLTVKLGARLESIFGPAVFGSCDVGDGVLGQGSATGVHGQSAAKSGTGAGVWGENTGPTNGIGVFGSSKSGDGVAGNGVNGVHGQGVSSGVLGENTGAGAGVTGTSAALDGVLGQGPSSGVHGQCTQQTTGMGVFGENIGGSGGIGVWEAVWDRRNRCRWL